MYLRLLYFRIMYFKIKSIFPTTYFRFILTTYMSFKTYKTCCWFYHFMIQRLIEKKRMKMKYRIMSTQIMVRDWVTMKRGRWTYLFVRCSRLTCSACHYCCCSWDAVSFLSSDWDAARCVLCHTRIARLSMSLPNDHDHRLRRQRCSHSEKSELLPIRNSLKWSHSGFALRYVERSAVHHIRTVARATTQVERLNLIHCHDKTAQSIVIKIRTRDFVVDTCPIIFYPETIRSSLHIPDFRALRIFYSAISGVFISPSARRPHGFWHKIHFKMQASRFISKTRCCVWLQRCTY